MLNNGTYETLLLTKMRMDELHRSAEQMRIASAVKGRKTIRNSKVVSIILHETGKALISTGNRLLKIA